MAPRVDPIALERGLRTLREREALRPVEPEIDIPSLIAAEVRRVFAAIPVPADGEDGEDGEDGKTPVKGVDYFDGEDGITPVKGVDYFDGVDGVGVRDISLDGDTLNFLLTDGALVTVSLAPMFARLSLKLADLVPKMPDIPKMPDMSFLKLDESQPFTFDGKTLRAHPRGGKSFDVLTMPDQATQKQPRGGGISGQRARAISREISFVAVQSDYTASAGDDVIECDTSSGDVVITVPVGRKTWLHIKRSGAGSVTVKTEDGTTIEGEDCRVLNVNLWALRIAWNGSEYREF